MSGESVTEDRTESAPLRGFDAFEVRLGDLMRGERATLGKSLLDVQRELRIRATYVAAIENGDLGAFESKGFVAGYVRSYARYLGFDPEWAFAAFCVETGFESVSGQLSEREPGSGTAAPVVRPGAGATDPFASGRFRSHMPAAPAMAHVNPGALGSLLVLALLLGGLGYGAWMVLQQVQRVTVAPVDAAPGVASAPPVAGVAAIEHDPAVAAARLPAEGLERLYRPQGLDLPVMVARDGPIAALDPARIGALAPDPATGFAAGDDGAADPLGAALRMAAQGRADDSDAPAIRVTAEGPPELALIARTPVWVRVRDPGGAVLFEKTLGAGESYVVPPLDGVPTVRAGNAGDLYLLVDGVPFGPAGAPGEVVDGIELTAGAVQSAFARTELPAGIAPATLAEAAD